MDQFQIYDSFTAIDFETASSAYFSACAVGIVKVVGREVVAKEYFLIQPPDNYYDKVNINIHGIKPEDTASADSFPAVWEKIKQYFNDTYIVAHNAVFDMSVLKATLDYYDIEQPNFIYFDSISVSRLNIPYGEKVANGLAECCAFYKIPLCEHHNALCDAEACACLVLYALNNNNRYKTIGTFLKMRATVKEFADVKLKKTFGKAKFRKIVISEVAAAVDTATTPKDDDFMGKTFVFTGELKKLTREQAYAKVIAGGGRIVTSVTKNVDVLVNADGQSSGKMKAALDLQAKGHHIKIVDDELFMQMLKNTGAVNLAETIAEFVASGTVKEEIS